MMDINHNNLPSDSVYHDDVIDRFLDGFADSSTCNLDFDLLLPTPPLLPLAQHDEHVEPHSSFSTINSPTPPRSSTRKKQSTSTRTSITPSKEALRKKRWRQTLSQDRKEMIKKREREQKRRRFHNLSEEGRAEHRLKDRIRKARERNLETTEQKRIRLNRERQRKAQLRAKRKASAVKKGTKSEQESVIESGQLEDYCLDTMKVIAQDITWEGAVATIDQAYIANNQVVSGSLFDDPSTTTGAFVCE